MGRKIGAFALIWSPVVPGLRGGGGTRRHRCHLGKVSVWHSEGTVTSGRRRRRGTVHFLFVSSFPSFSSSFLLRPLLHPLLPSPPPNPLLTVFDLPHFPRHPPLVRPYLLSLMFVHLPYSYFFLFFLLYFPLLLPPFSFPPRPSSLLHY